jgi:hypothetical protein
MLTAHHGHAKSIAAVTCTTSGEYADRAASILMEEQEIEGACATKKLHANSPWNHRCFTRVREATNLRREGIPEFREKNFSNKIYKN